MTAPAEPVTPTRRRTWMVPVALAAGATVVRLPIFFATRHVGFDESVYGASIIGMRHGQWPYKDLFSAMGPLHFVFLRAGDLLGLQTRFSPRVAPLLAGVGITLATYYAARLLTRGGVYAPAVAAALVATSGSLLWTAGTITGDGMANALAMAAVLAALEYRSRPRTVMAVLTGLAFGAALAVKPIVIPVVIPIVIWMWARDRVRDLAWAAGSLVLLGLLSVVPFGFGRVWDQSVTYHRDSEAVRRPFFQLHKLWDTLVERDLPILLALALGVVAILVFGGRARFRRDTAVVGAWLAACVVLLMFEPEMFRNHAALVIGPLALLVALHPPAKNWLSIVVLVLVLPYWWTHLDDVLQPGHYTGADKRVVEALRDLPDGAYVISDEPGFVWQAGKVTPPMWNDTSIKRVEADMITTESLAEAASDPDVCAVVVWSERFGDLPGLDVALTEVGFEQTETYGDERALWLKPDCTPGG